MDKKTETLQWLDQNCVVYEVLEHPAVYTIEEMDKLGIQEKGHIWKNLFLRDAKGKRHFLVSLDGHKSVDLDRLGALLGTKLSFASEERLQKYLNLSKGAVTPLGVLYDTAAAVEVILDQDLEGKEPIGLHPCDNTATVFLRYADILRLIKQNGNKLSVIAL